MTSIKYFFQYLVIIILFFIFKILGFKASSNFSSKIISLIGPFFRSQKVIKSNIIKAFPDLDEVGIKKITHSMWSNYGRILSDYVFIKNFRSSTLKDNLQIEGREILDEIKHSNEPVVFISGHFNNFELMAMQIDKSGINLATVYRPLNNKFLNFLMEKIRKKYICKNQIKKGISGTKQLLSSFKGGSSIALMIDQRVSQGVKSSFFKHDAYTTTIPAQFVKKFNCKVVPVYIERIKKFNFKLTIHKPLSYSNNDSIESITLDLNNLLEKMILKNPGQWIWSHNLWK